MLWVWGRCCKLLSHSYTRQPSCWIEAGRRQNIFWEGGRLNASRHRCTLEFLKDCSLPSRMSFHHVPFREMFMPIKKKHTHKCGLLIAHKVKKACGNMWSQRHKSRQAHWNLSMNCMSVLHIWATYITNHCALCNASLLIFKRISLWSEL